LKKSRDPVFVAALEYESATLNALQALAGTDDAAVIAACMRFIDAIQALDAMPDRDRGLAYLRRRGGVPNFAWKRIHAFMEIFVANRTPTVH
jgi:hypothetical protein